MDALLERDFKDGNLTFSGEFKDRGIDALFRGKYGRSKGVWAFQYKYHDPAQGRTQSRKSVRADLKSELSRVRKPDFKYYVLVTNVELIRADFDWIDKNFNRLPYEVRVWDRKKLSASLLRYPTTAGRPFSVKLDDLKQKGELVTHEDTPFRILGDSFCGRSLRVLLKDIIPFNL